MTMTVECPNCGAQVPWNPDSEWKPFCSERCKMIDLGAWFSEERAIPDQPESASRQWDEDKGLSSFSPDESEEPQ
jgi:endogenous inhibitor of DNA gyrase (YacG/DUF329 family)